MSFISFLFLKCEKIFQAQEPFILNLIDTYTFHVILFFGTVGKKREKEYVLVQRNVLSVSNLFHSIDLTDFGKTVRPIFEIQSVKKDIQDLIFCFKIIILHVLTPSWIMIIFFLKIKKKSLNLN